IGLSAYLGAGQTVAESSRRPAPASTKIAPTTPYISHPSLLVSGFRFPLATANGMLSTMSTILLLLLVPPDVPRISTAVVRTWDLATLTHREAQWLDGRRVRVRLDLESEPAETQDGRAIVYDCVSPDDVNRTVWLWPGQEVKEVMVIEG